MRDNSSGGGGVVTTIVVAALVSALVGGLVGGSAGVVTYGIAHGVGPASERGAGAHPFDPLVLAAPKRYEGAFVAGEPSVRSFQVPLPADTVFVEVKLESGDRDLDLKLALGVDAAREGDWEAVGDSASGTETTWIARYDRPPIEGTPLCVQVEDMDGGDEAYPYTLRFHILAREVAARLTPGGEALESALTHESGHRLDFDVVLPDGADAVRVDILDARQNLEIAADATAVLDPAHAALVTDSVLAREGLVLERHELRLGPGEQTVSVVIFNPDWIDRRIPFTLLVTAGSAPPDAARRVPLPFVGATPEERAAARVVDIMTDADEGSGVVVRADGVILTAAHLFDGVPDDTDDVIVLVCDDPHREPIEALRGRVVRRDDDLDLAIVQVTQTVHGDPLPAGFRLPATPIRWAPRARLGERVHAIGYPVLHASDERSELTWTSGTLAGFETPDETEALRFDAEIRGGSSGGALLDEDMRLLGITVAVHEDTSVFTATGLATPVTEIPEEWLPLLR